MKKVVISESEFNKLIDEFLKDRNIEDRNSSYDYCYNYFYEFYKENRVEEIWDNNNLITSCLHLWFYLASWWMLRWSSPLLQKNIRFFETLIKNVIAKDKYKHCWGIDLDSYNDNNINKLIELKEAIISTFHNYYNTDWKEYKPTDTLITKIMLWVHWNVPALDENFVKWLRVGNTLNKNTLKALGKIYEDNKKLINWRKEFTLDIKTWNKTKNKYTKAKILDMYWFKKWITFKDK